MPPVSKKIVVTAPPSKSATHSAKVNKVKSLRGKSNRTPAESQELIDNLISLLPPGTLD